MIDDVQGVTTDGRFWFISAGRAPILHRVPISLDLNQSTDANTYSWWDPLPEVAHYDHIGALTYWDGRLYAPLFVRDDLSEPGILAEFQLSSLAMVSWSSVGYRIGWCGVNPVNGLLYAEEREAGGNIVLYSYAPGTLQRVGGPFRLRARNGDLFNPPNWNDGPVNFQGGAFSNNGHLYVVTSDHNRLYWFDMLTGVEVGMLSIDDHVDDAHELEGMVLIDLDTVTAPCGANDDACSGGRLRGQLHIMQNKGGNYSFHHIGVAPSERGRI